MIFKAFLKGDFVKPGFLAKVKSKNKSDGLNNMINEIRSKLIACLLFGILIISCTENSFGNEGTIVFPPTYPVVSLESGQPTLSVQTSVTDRDTLPYYSKYHENLSSLIDYLDNNGFEIHALLDDSRFEIYEGIGDRFRRSAERRALSLDEYKNILGFADKRSKITDFIDLHYNKLEEAEQTYDIPKYVIAAIIGVESDFGRNIGSFNPFNAYVSMYAEEYRADFAKAQLEELLKFTTRNSIDVYELKSSYAGAMSFAQFIPYSLNKWFVGDDIFDMDNNIMSIGNYLDHFKQREGTVERAVFRYNPSQLYTDAVLDLAQEAETLYSASR